jgi:hypothetical protein
MFLALFGARALARTGRREESRQVLALADAERGRVTSPDLLGEVWELTPARYHGLVAGTMLLLDEPADAVTQAAEAIALAQATPQGQRHLYAELRTLGPYIRSTGRPQAQAEANRRIYDLMNGTQHEPWQSFNLAL